MPGTQEWMPEHTTPEPTLPQLASWYLSTSTSQFNPRNTLAVVPLMSILWVTWFSSRHYTPASNFSVSCLLQDQFHLLQVAQFTNWGLQRPLTSRPSVCTSISSSAKAYFSQSDCCFEHKDLLLYFFYVSRTHSHSADELPAAVCVVRIHFILPFPSPVQTSPVQTSLWKNSSPVLLQWRKPSWTPKAKAWLQFQPPNPTDTM